MPRPIVPPRFDSFCEQIIGTWNPSSKNSESCIAREVEEVMRSCGGAVQGIQEQSIISTNSTLTSMYLNRADDGFVYFDCGTYTKCPTQQLPEADILTILSGEETVVLPIVASISFSTQPKSRLFFDLTTNSCNVLIKSSGLAGYESEPTSDVSVNALDLYDIKWGKETICRMEHGNQPWVLQRAKWEASSSINNHNLKNKCKMNADEIKLNGWIKSWDMTKNGSESSTYSENPKDFTCRLPNNTSRIIDMGGVCMNSGEVKSLLIHYDDKGSLQAIVLKEGLYK